MQAAVLSVENRNVLEAEKEVDLIDVFLQKYQGETRRGYSRIMREIEKFAYEYMEFSKLPVNSGIAIQSMYTAFVRHKRFKSASYANWYKSVFQYYLNYLHDSGVIVQPIKLPEYFRIAGNEGILASDIKVLEASSRILSEDEFKLLLIYCKKVYLPIYVPLMIMWNYGLRINELLWLKRKHFIKYKGRYFMYKFGKYQKKMNKGTWKEVPEELMKYIKWHFNKKAKETNSKITKDTHFFCRMSFNRHGIKYNFTDIPFKSDVGFRKLLKKVSSNCLGKAIQTHDIRRSRATSLRKKGVDHYDVEKALDMSASILKRYDKEISNLNRVGWIGDDKRKL